jgi:hypothetical protein
MIICAGYGQAQTAQAPIKLGSVTITTDVRTRVESWDWFEAVTADNSYSYSGSLFRLGFSQQNKRVDWQLEWAAPVLGWLPQRAVASGAQGQLGLGATYYAANDRRQQVGMGFVKQGFLRLKAGDGANTLRFGRFEYIDGTEVTAKDATLAALKRDRIAHRLIGNFAFSHVGRSLDGLQYVHSRPSTNVSMVIAKPTRGVFQVDGWGELDVGLASVTLTRQLAFGKSAGEFRVFGIQYHDWRDVLKTDNRPQAARSGDKANLRIVTAGGHYLHAFPSSAGTFDVLFWGVLQGGRWGALDHRAGAADVEVGYQPRERVLKPWIRAGYSYGSGDDNPNDNRHNTFFQILPTPRIYARMPFYNMMNNEDTFGELVLRPHTKVLVRSAVHMLRLAERNDLWYQGGGAFQPWTFGYGGRPSNGNRSLATVFDVGAEIQVNTNVAVGAYFADAESKSVTSAIHPNDPRSRFGYVELRLRR